MKILLIEDDLEIREMVKGFLEKENYELITAADGEEGYRIFRQEDIDLVLLDLMIPKMDGLEVMQKIRSNSVVPIIIMSAKDTDLDKSLGLGLGADDYLTKPFSLTELLARIKANIIRTTQYTVGIDVGKEQILKAGELAMNLESYTVTRGEKVLDLTAKEFEILKLLMKNPKKVYTKEQIYALVWNDAYLGDENAVNVHISRLRNKVEEDAREPKYIITVWGIGYKLGE